MNVLALWFGLKAPVSRKAYLASGAALMVLKVVIDNAIALAATGKPWPLTAYLAPSVMLKSEAMRQAQATGPTPDAALALLAIIALPFLWVGVTMTIRRAADAGYSPWLGILFLVPGINYLTMLFFAAVPSTPKDEKWVPVQLGPFRQNRDAAPLSEMGPVPPGLKSALLGLIAPVALGMGMLLISVKGAAIYGGALFFATPFIMGMTTAIIYNRTHVRPLGATIGLSLLSIVLCGLVILLFAFEGILCLMMAFPIAAAVATLGALVGYALASQGSKKTVRNAAFMVATLPALTGVESQMTQPTLREVTTSVEIDAPPEQVWPNVVGFSDLPPPPQWFFRLGIAYPMRATIKGTGVGAVRHCEFSTGPFVEPITTWDEPRRLAFDVTSQPPSMTELSPYQHIDAPHLEGYMVSRGGEFRLVPLPGGRTRLEGSTFYTLSIYPEGYWVVWGELLLHAIHGRVLDHIKNLAEHPDGAPLPPAL